MLYLCFTSLCNLCTGLSLYYICQSNEALAREANFNRHRNLEENHVFKLSCLLFIYMCICGYFDIFAVLNI